MKSKNLKISTMITFILLLFSFSCNSTSPDAVQSGGGKVENLDVKTFKEKYAASSNAVLLDVRTPEEIAEGKIEGSVALDFNSPGFYPKLDSLDKNKEYFIYCKVGGRSGKTCDYLSKKGYKTYNLEGGIDAWNRAK